MDAKNSKKDMVYLGILRVLGVFRDDEVDTEIIWVYKIEDPHVIVYVVAVGIRKDKDSKDIYELARNIIGPGCGGGSRISPSINTLPSSPVSTTPSTTQE